MAAKENMVEIPASVWEAMQKRLDALEQASRLTTEAVLNSKAKILDPAYEALKVEIAKPASVRTQEIADRRFGTAGKRYRVWLDSTTPDGKKGPDISEHFPLVLSANSEHEAKAFYLDVMGITQHKYTLKHELVNAA